MIEDFANEIPEELRDCSGSVFYSGRNAFRTESPLYMLGVNPGGCPKLQADETIRIHTRKVMDDESDDWSAYRNESWRNAKPGTSGMQPRILHLLKQLEYAPGDVPASNVVFVRSRREADVKSTYTTLAEVCWPFHRAVIEQLQPKVILCFGRTPGDFVRRKLRANRLVGEFVEDNNRRWRNRAFRGESGPVVVVATHPSIADWTASATDPSSLVKRALSGNF